MFIININNTIVITINLRNINVTLTIIMHIINFIFIFGGWDCVVECFVHVVVDCWKACCFINCVVANNSLVLINLLVNVIINAIERTLFHLPTQEPDLLGMKQPKTPIHTQMNLFMILL